MNKFNLSLRNSIKISGKLLVATTVFVGAMSLVLLVVK